MMNNKKVTTFGERLANQMMQMNLEGTMVLSLMYGEGQHTVTGSKDNQEREIAGWFKDQVGTMSPIIKNGEGFVIPVSKSVIMGFLPCPLVVKDGVIQLIQNAEFKMLNVENTEGNSLMDAVESTVRSISRENRILFDVAECHLFI